ncbi:hypothetical protein [Fodinicola feengrottensis]|uniref:hypothetical protein n=1 Tax=Fodinicola feengrottensis TaxID=435914 RepID=UPI002442EAC3|nr:hypothetical protein [Fodinicola feengrottensis]
MSARPACTGDQPSPSCPYNEMQSRSPLNAPNEQGQRHGDAAEESAVGEQAWFDQRAVLAAPFPEQEDQQQDHPGGEQTEAPGGPTGGLALDQRIDDRDQPQPHQANAAEVELDARMAGAPRQRADGQRQH